MPEAKMPVIAVVGAPGSKKKELADYIYLYLQKNHCKVVKIYNYADTYLHNCFEQQGFPKDGKYFDIDQRHVMQEQCILEKNIPKDCFTVLSSALMVNYCIAMHKAYSGNKEALDNDIPEYFFNVIEMSNNYDLIIYLPLFLSSYEAYLDHEKIKKIKEAQIIDKEIRNILSILKIDYEILGNFSRKERKIKTKQILREKFPELELTDCARSFSHETNPESLEAASLYYGRKAKGEKKWKVKKGDRNGR